MIRREEPDATWIIHQAAHARIAGLIAEHWDWEGAAPLFPREELILAALSHDAGWARTERWLRLNRDGWPRTFTEMVLLDHFAIWDASIESVMMQNRYAGLLTSLHCTALYEYRLRYVEDTPDDRAQIHDFLDRWYTWQDALRAELTNHPYYAQAVQPDQLGENVRLLQVWDYLSLVLGMSPVHEQPLDDVPFQLGIRGILQLGPDGVRGMTLDPYPLDDALTIWLEARQLPDEPFASDEDFWAWMEDAPYQPLQFELKPREDEE